MELTIPAAAAASSSTDVSHPVAANKDLEEIIRMELGLFGFSTRFAASISNQLVKLYPEIKLGKKLGKGMYSTAYLYTFRQPDGTKGAKVLKMTNLGSASKSTVENKLNRERMGGGFMAYHPFGERVLETELAVVYDAVSKEMILVSAKEIQDMFYNPELREEKEWVLVGTVSEFIEGSLDFDKVFWSYGQPFSTEAVYQYGLQILEGVGAIHGVTLPEDSEKKRPKKTVVHRDLKLGNMLFIPPKGMAVNEALAAGKGGVKILDFGFARIIEERAKRHSNFGTPESIAPEVVRGEPYNGKADVFSVATIVSMLATGCRAYDSLDVFDHNMKYSVKTLKNHITQYPKVDPQLADFIKKGGKLDPEKRLTVEEALAHPFFASPPAATVVGPLTPPSETEELTLLESTLDSSFSASASSEEKSLGSVEDGFVMAETSNSGPFQNFVTTQEPLVGSSGSCIIS